MIKICSVADVPFTHFHQKGSGERNWHCSSVNSRSNGSFRLFHLYMDIEKCLRGLRMKLMDKK